MKICLINHSFPPQIGGGETHMYLLAKGFAEKGHEVLVITSGSDNFIEKNSEHFTVARIKNFGNFEKGKASFRDIFDDFSKVLMSQCFDIVHVHNFMPGLAYSMIASLVKTKKTIFTFHSTPIPAEGKILGHFSEYSVEKAFTSFILKLSFYDFLVCPSRYYYDWALKLGADKKKSKLVYHGIDVDNFSVERNSVWRGQYGFKESDYIIVSPARMIQRKGILDLVKAINVIKAKNVKLFIPTSVKNGSFQYLKMVRNYIRENDLLDRVKIIVDEIPFELMPEVYANCDICVLPSHIEGLGLVSLEAMAAGIPVVGSNTSGISEVIEDEINGLLVNVNNFQELAEKILKIKNNSKLRDRIVNNGKKSVNGKFSLGKQLKSLEKIYSL